MIRFFSALIFLASQFVYSQKNLPIIAFQGIPGDYNSGSHYANLKNAGFNVNLQMYSNMAEVKNALILCQKYGVKLIFSVSGLKESPEKFVNQVKDHPSLLGYYIEDEPNTDRFSALNSIVKKIRLLDKNHVTYINLLPNYATPDQLKAPNYNEYVKMYATKVNANVISFDHYALVDNKIRFNFYQNLEIIKQVSLQNNLPFWAFACSVIHFNYRKPTVGGLKLQQFSNLLYGAEGLQYYTYWGVNDEYWKLNNYSYAIVDSAGKPTPTYNVVKVVNEQIKKLSWIFTKSKVDSVFHVGDSIPLGTKRMNFLPKKFRIFKTYERKALVSFMSAGKRKFVIVQNKDIFRPMPFNYQVEAGVSMIDNATGKIKTISAREAIYNIPPGDILIFTY